jgi:hypothetical protein
VTLRLRRDVPSLRSHRLVREVERSLRASCERGRFRVVHYSPVDRRAPAVIDPASSGRWFLGWTRAHAPPAGRAPVAKARSWLLRVGWWRHGRIDPREVPGARH